MTVRARRRRALVAEEFEGVDLGDPRRGRRVKKVAERLAAQPDAGLPEAMVDRAMLEALYRHLSSEGVSFEGLMAPHFAKCAKRVGEMGDVYAVHDTTTCTFAGESRRRGLGRIADKEQGFLAHVTLAVSAAGDRLPLGVLATELIVRGDRKTVTQSERRQAPLRESLRWARGVEQASRRVRAPERLIHVADREGDIYELLAALLANGRRFIIRAGQDRSVDVGGQLSRLFDAARETVPTYAVDLPISRRPKGLWYHKHHLARPARTAHLTMAALTVRLRRPQWRPTSLPASLSINVVHVFELCPPPGLPLIEWLLITSEPISARHEIERVVDGYRARWTIEDYFKAVKTGCAYEARQLESFHALANMFAYTLVIAYALLLMRVLVRAKRSLPADAVLSDTEIRVLRRAKRSRPSRRRRGLAGRP